MDRRLEVVAENVSAGGGRVDLKSPATTLALLKLDAVVGVRGFVDDSGQRRRSVGITKADLIEYLKSL